MCKRLLILALLTVRFQCVAQIQKTNKHNSQPTLSGIILDTEDGKTLPLVHIFNMTSRKGAISDSSGEFSIPFNPTDSIVFSAVGFEDYIFTVSNSSSVVRHYFIKIELNQSTLELSPVTIYAFKDEVTFKNDILNLEIAGANQKIIIPGSFTGTPQPAKTKVYFNGGLACDGCITSIFNLFNKEVKESKKYKRILEGEPLKYEVYNKYNPEIVQELTGLPEDDLADFMVFCALSDDFILSANEYDIILSVSSCFGEFVQNSNKR